MRLTDTERLAVHGLRTMEAELAATRAAFASELEKAHGLGPGALGKTHSVEASTGEIIEVVPQDSPKG